MAAQHSKGPWSFSEAWGRSEGEPPQLCFHEIYDAERNIISSTWAGPHLANARLIAAAPELLEALKGLMPTNVCVTNPNISDALVIPCDVTMGELRAAYAALSKAIPSSSEGGE